MKFTRLPLEGLFLIAPEPKEDERGAFIRVFCGREFEAQGLETNFVQANVSTNIHAGTVRGLHYQRPPHAEVKLVRCIRGAIYDVVVDIRRNSPSYGKYFATELSETNGLAMYVPIGFAHGYQSLTDAAVVHYMVSAFYAPIHEGGVHHADPTIGIKWPLPIAAVSPKDAGLPFLTINACG
jgi:dTDP-4-dehydrorhamnose 3,5-epimerase